MRMSVAGGRAGARQAAERGEVAIIVDALRASATTASLLHYGVAQIVVVEAMEAAFAEARKRPGCLLAGERGGVRVEGFDLGNSPLQEPRADLTDTVIFSSSNMSRCCVGAARCPATFLGTLVTCSACAALALRAAQEHQCDLTLVPAGAVVDEYKLVLEDYVAAGALLATLEQLSGGAALPTGDAARAALDVYAAALQRGLPETFLQADNGRDLCALGFEPDVRFACRRDLFATVPTVRDTYRLDNGEPAAVLAPATTT